MANIRVEAKAEFFVVEDEKHLLRRFTVCAQLGSSLSLSLRCSSLFWFSAFAPRCTGMHFGVSGCSCSCIFQRRLYIIFPSLMTHKNMKILNKFIRMKHHILLQCVRISSCPGDFFSLFPSSFSSVAAVPERMKKRKKKKLRWRKKRSLVPRPQNAHNAARKGSQVGRRRKRR